MKATLCELAERPEQFNGKMVSVRASVAGNDLWIDDFDQKPPCASRMGVVVMLPDQVKPRPDFEVTRDRVFAEFFDDVRKGLNVQATFEGRLDAKYTWRNQKQVWIAGGQEQSRGFGKSGQYGGRIVLRRISDVVARPVPRK